jgi:predicted O-methyltransferase YrrM
MINHPLDPLINRYCEKHSSQVDKSILDIERSTYLNTVKPKDASDFIQGRLLSTLSHLMTPSFIVEVGTFTGYATICLAEGLAPHGRILTIESNDKLAPLIEEHLKMSEICDKVKVVFGRALDILPSIDQMIDILYIDAAKKEYQTYFDQMIDKVRSGGLIIADNVLWKGKVLDDVKDAMATSLDSFNQYVANDDRVEAFILPYRDGLSIIRKK